MVRDSPIFFFFPQTKLVHDSNHARMLSEEDKEERRRRRRMEEDGGGGGDSEVLVISHKSPTKRKRNVRPASENSMLPKRQQPRHKQQREEQQQQQQQQQQRKGYWRGGPCSTPDPRTGPDPAVFTAEELLQLQRIISECCDSTNDLKILFFLRYLLSVVAVNHDSPDGSKTISFFFSPFSVINEY